MRKVTGTNFLTVHPPVTLLDAGTKGAEIICGNDSIQVNVLTRRPFEGHLYVKGRFNDPSCSFHAKKGGNSKDISLRIPLMGCGLEEQFIVSEGVLLSNVKDNIFFKI